MKRSVEIEINVPCVRSQEADALLARLEYLKDVRKARAAASEQLREAGYQLTTQQLDEFLSGGSLP